MNQEYTGESLQEGLQQDYIRESFEEMSSFCAGDVMEDFKDK